ncbi:MAG: hypothetical protein Alpg2KO_23550 [Alphaproteobacteria bacterium]
MTATATPIFEKFTPLPDGRGQIFRTGLLTGAVASAGLTPRETKSCHHIVHSAQEAHPCLT